MINTFIQPRACPNCQAKCIKPLEFRLLQHYHCKCCHKRVQTPRYFTVLTVLVLIVLYCVCLELDKNENVALGLLIVYLLFEAQINALVAPLVVLKDK